MRPEQMTYTHTVSSEKIQTPACAHDHMNADKAMPELTYVIRIHLKAVA